MKPDPEIAITPTNGLAVAASLLHLLEVRFTSDVTAEDLPMLREVVDRARRGIVAHIESLEINAHLAQVRMVNEMVGLVDWGLRYEPG